MTAALAALAVPAAGAAAYAWWEAGRLRCEVVEVAVPDLPAALEGLRIAHLSDFHLGSRLGRGDAATARAVEWVAGRRPDLVCLTGDLVARRRGEGLLAAHLRRLGVVYAVLGNHDVRRTRDPFARGDGRAAAEGAIVLRNERHTLRLAGVAVHLVGLDPGRAGDARRDLLAPAPAGGLTVVLVHDPGDAELLPPGAADLILAGHLHAGQIVVPWPGRPVSLSHPRARHLTGLRRVAGGLLHVSAGTGTSFVPFRLCARPAVTELVLRGRLPWSPGSRPGDKSV